MKQMIHIYSQNLQKYFIFTLHILWDLFKLSFIGAILLYLEKGCLLSFTSFRKYSHGEEMTKVLSYNETLVTTLASQWVTYPSMVWSFLQKHFQKAAFFPLKGPFPKKFQNKTYVFVFVSFFVFDFVFFFQWQLATPYWGSVLISPLINIESEDSVLYNLQ